MKNKFFIILILCLILSVITELFIFNFTGIRTYLKKNKDVVVDYYVTNETYTSYNALENNVELKTTNTLNQNYSILYIKDINFPVSSININYANEYSDKISYTLKYTAYGNKYVPYTIETKTLNDSNNNYISFNSKVECYDIILIVESNNPSMEISQIIINHPNFNILPIRIIILFILNIFIYLIISKKIYKFNTLDNPKLKNILLLITAIFVSILCIYAYYNINKENFNNLFSDDISSYTFNDYTTYLKNVLENNLQNSTDYQNSNEISKTNSTYYYNNLAIYLISLPIYYFTGYYLNAYFLNMLLMVSIIFITAIFYNKATTYFVKKCSIFNFILGYIVLILGSNILFIRKANYSNISLLMNILIILFSFIVLFNILKTTTQNKIKRKIYFLLLGILIGLLLFTTLVGYIYMILFYTLIIKFKNNTNDKNKPNIKIDLILMSVPILIFIIITIFYNMHYTDLNSTNIENLSITNITKGVIEAIVITPNIDTFKFPFSKMDTVNNNFFKSEYSYEDNLLGIISFPVIWLLLLKKFLTYYEDKKNTYKFINIVILFSFIILICNLAIYEISEIYTLEFKFLLLFCAILFVLKNIENKNIFSGNTVTDKAFLILSIINILVIFPISNSTDLQYLYYTNIDFVNTLKNTFMFWI